DARRLDRDEADRSAAARLPGSRRTGRASARDHRRRAHVGPHARGDRGQRGRRVRAPLLVRARIATSNQPPATSNQMTHTITLIPGDGIGPEVTDGVVRILKEAGVAIEWEHHLAGVPAFERTGQSLPIELVDSIRRNKVAL